MAVTPLIIDCDPGVDDAIALMLALRSPELSIQGITVVAGNVPLPLTQRNARQICDLMARQDIPVYAGCPRPMLRSLVTAEEVHGKTGLDGATLPPPRLSLQADHAVAYLIKTLRAAATPVTLATLGPLTNLAIAIIQAPDILENIQQIVAMGGGITQGNITPVAEFNIYVDPHAAQVVFDASVPITLISLDVTHQVLTTPDRLASLRAIPTAAAQIAADLLGHYGKADEARLGTPGAPLHDPCVIAYLLNPDLFTQTSGTVQVELTSPLTLGQTVVHTPSPPSAAPITLVTGVEATGIYELLMARISQPD